MTSAMSSGVATRPIGTSASRSRRDRLVLVHLLGHPGAHHAGREAVDADAVAPELLGEHRDEHDQRGLARAVGPEVGVRVAARHGRHRDDRAARGGERVVGRLGEEPRRARVHREHAVPVLHRVLRERARPVDARVADHAVEAAEARDRLVHHAPGRVRGGHVARERQGRRAQLAQLLHQRVERGRGAEVHRRDLRLAPRRLRVARQPQAGGPADPARRSRDQGAHGLTPP